MAKGLFYPFGIWRAGISSFVYSLTISWARNVAVGLGLMGHFHFCGDGEGMTSRTQWSSDSRLWWEVGSKHDSVVAANRDPGIDQVVREGDP